MSKQLANNLSRLQKIHNLSVSSLARTTGVSRRTVDRILGRDIDVRGQAVKPYTPTAGTIQSIAQAFGVDGGDVTKRLPRFVIDSVNPA